MTDYPRDMLGYGANPPDPKWPGGAKMAHNVREKKKLLNRVRRIRGQVDAVEKALAAHRRYIMNETLAVEWEVGQADAIYTDERAMGSESWTLEFRKA